MADTGQGQQPLCHLVEESNLVIAGGDPTEQAGNALVSSSTSRRPYRRLMHRAAS